MSTDTTRGWSKYAREYDPIKCGSIDGTDTVPHDRGVIRALNSTYRPNEKVTGNPERTIFIGRLHIKTNEDTLCKKFEKFGKIRNCRVVRDIVTGVSKCYAFIEFKRSSSAQCAVNEMQKAYIDDCEIVVEHEFERTMKGWKPRRLGGGFGGRKESGQLRFGGRARPFQKPFELYSKPSHSRDKR
ncbi:unnamed protein product [Hermetia illucens]|uniref:U11/U12 small nuclear ribonucleoprotein 35 kDa protein n=1 Tax=Hermetia illucens TaxID=343691 RepID=A0A7R8YX09_HERIL|nr:U11/U12 small nuclear ribonucleoprotein 35 kDa protein-like isoform X2 [Hermetia illucens]CAD7088488.1 unnamed protein product [Hermetia illucens]